MKETVYVENIDMFLNILQSIMRLVPSCKFNIDEKGLTVMGINDSSTIRSYFESNCVKSKSSVQFCLMDVQKLYRSLNIIKEFNNENNIELIFDGTYLKTLGESKFKLVTVKEEAIQKYITSEIKVVLKPTFGCTIDSLTIKKLIGLEFITSSDYPKIYFIKENKKILAEVDDKQTVMGDSIGIPATENYFGDWNVIIKLKMESFRVFNILNSNEIKFHMTDKNVLEVFNEKTDSDYYSKVRMIVSVLK